jgi:hypothetical protein
VSFSSCDLLQDLGLIPEDEPAVEPEPGPEPPPKPKVGNPDNPSIKAKFGITATEKAGVTATFNTLSAYIQAGGLSDNVIRLGDWIDLEGGLTVDAYNEKGAINNLQNTDVIPSPLPFDGYDGKTLRLIVVGINSFHSGRGVNATGPTQNGDTGGKYDITANDATPHVVFQFQNIPVIRRMNPTETNAGGYRDSEMRSYVTGNFLAGLKNAGVPAGALWAPKRVVSVKGASGSNEISDLLWLPTEREMFGGNTNSVAADETEENQARLEYYDSNEKRVKYLENGNAKSYWEASPSYRDVSNPDNKVNRSFCSVGMSSGSTNYSLADYIYMAAPPLSVSAVKSRRPARNPAPICPAVSKTDSALHRQGKPR